MEYSLLKLLVCTMEDKLGNINKLFGNNEYCVALREFIAASKKLMKFF